MEHVSSKKLEAVAKFLVDDEVDGNYLCGSFLEYLDDSFNAPKCTDDEAFCMEDCPMKSKENFLNWIKSDKKLSIKEVKRPEAEDFVEYIDNEDKPVVLWNDYAKALERYCTDLENLFANLEYDLDSAECENRELVNKLEKIRGVLDGKY